MAKLRIAAHAGLAAGALAFASAGLYAIGPIVAGEPGAAATPQTVAAQDPQFRDVPPADERDSTVQPPPPPASDDVANHQSINYSKELKPGRRLRRGDNLFSSLSGFRLRMREDGDLILCPIDDEAIPKDIQEVLEHGPIAMTLYNTVIWSSKTGQGGENGGPGAYCEMKTDGDFVIHDEAGRVCFRTGTSGHPGAFLRLQNDGNLVIYTPQLEVLWASNTEARPRPEDQDPF